MGIDSTVRWFNSTMADAPVIGETAGSLIAALDACLINGFGQKTVDSVAVSGGVATVTISAGHSYEKHAVIRLSGAAVAEVNGDWRVKSVPGGSTFTFDCPGIPDGSVAGTITCIRATPGYWEKAFSDTGKAAYRSTHPDSLGCYWFIDDSASGAAHVPVRGYRGMTGISEGSGQFPTVTNFNLRRTVTGNVLFWAIYADERFVYLFVMYHPSYDPAFYCFGDIPSYFDGDVGATIVAAHETNYTSGGNQFNYATGFGSTSSSSTLGCYMASDFTGVSEPLSYRPSAPNSNNSYPSGDIDFPLSLSASGYAFIDAVHIIQHNPSNSGKSIIRGTYPGLLCGLTSRSTTLLPSERLKVLDPVEGSAYALQATCMASSTNGGYVVVDLFGPWR